MESVTYQQFVAARKAAREYFQTLQSKYPSLHAYLVWAPARGQAPFDASTRQFLEFAPEIFIADDAKTSALALFRQLHDAELTDDSVGEIRQLTDAIERIGQQLVYEPATQVELRFHQLNYSLIWQLQRDALVDVARTPQRRASICIVLGTLGRFAGQSAGLA